jgi:hypothetical protein
MIPVGAIIGVVVAIRLLTRDSQAEQAQTGPASTTEAGYLVFTLFVLLPVTLGAGVGLLAGEGWCAPLLLGGLALSFPWTTARWVFIPMGWPRAAYRFGTLAMASWGPDRFGGRALAAAWALLRSRNPSPEDQAWVRSLCQSVSLLDPAVTPRLARKLALEWSLADAAAQGRWHEVLELSERGRGPFSLAAFFRAAARRLLGEPRAGRFALVARWVLARRWWATWPLLKRAWHVPPAPPAEPETQVPGAHEPLARALELHAALARVPAGQEAEALVRATDAWDRALESTHVWDLADEHARGMGLRAGVEAVEALVSEVTEELAAWALAREVPLARLEPRNELLDEVTYLARNEVLERVEAAVLDVSRRLEEQRPLDSAEEWRLFLALQRQCTLARTLGGPDARRLAFEAVNAPLCNLGAWLFNEREERAIANGMFRWLLAESLRVGSDEDQRRYQNNVDCGS